MLGAPAALVALAWLALDERPALVHKAELTPAQVARAEALAAAHDPRQSVPGALRSVTLATEDVELAANYLVASHGGGAKVALQPGALMLWVTARVPANPFGEYVNAEAVLRETAGLPKFDRLSVGRLPVPAPIADRLLARAFERLGAATGGMQPADLVDSVRISGGQLQIVYRWREDVPERLRAALLPAADQERLHAYQQRLAQLTAAASLPRRISLRMLLEPMLQFAASRSSASDPVAENRAALLVLAFYVNGRGLAAVVPQAHAWPRAAPRKVTLGGRHDLAQHFSVSAALAASAGSPLADAVGVYKETEDARDGSGFSFADIAADRAGSVFGTRATRSAESARTLQQRLLGATVEADFMPPIDGLPENMNDGEFKRRFGGVGQPAYRRMEAEVERRIAALALYR